ncbi:MAG: biopolymer transporter ExbD [Deltaproteobacteria bacterium]|nr:biopolymer transporter ExbD [Deltaproteobacteria bacterium]
MGFTVGPQKGPRSEINVTPMVDVVLVLLIIFMVVTPMLQRNKDVVLPRATNIDEVNREEDPLTISITSDQSIWVGNAQVAVADVKKRVSEALVETPNRLVLIKGDERLPIKQVRLVMKEVQDAGAKSVGLGVDKPEGEP